MRDPAVTRSVFGKTRRRGFSLIELLIVIAIILVIVTIAVPQYNKQMMSAHETAAIQAIQTIHAVETQYYSQFGRYAVSLAELGPPASGAAGRAGYAISAVPESFNSSGRRTFYSDQTLVVRNNWSQEPATVSSSELK
jgi:type IV pilus assembly protein PilA